MSIGLPSIAFDWCLSQYVYKTTPSTTIYLLTPRGKQSKAKSETSENLDIHPMLPCLPTTLLRKQNLFSRKQKFLLTNSYTYCFASAIIVWHIILLNLQHSTCMYGHTTVSNCRHLSIRSKVPAINSPVHRPMFLRNVSWFSQLGNHG